MRKIELSTGNFALVDDCDYMFLFLYRWYEVQQGKKKIAVRRTVDGKFISMHKDIMGQGKWSHVDGNGLNNCRSNIVKYNVSRNNGYAKNYSNEFKGVTRISHNRYVAQVYINGKVVYLCSSNDKNVCAWVYDAVIKSLRSGGFLNMKNFDVFVPKDIRIRLESKIEGIRLSERTKKQFQAA